ncbi:hypothetical protein ACFE04_012745 [Oxalis oulophora]
MAICRISQHLVGIPSDREQYIHRLGRTGREGKEGEGILLLAPWEQYFLHDLKDLPLEECPLPHLDPDINNKIMESMGKIDSSIKEAAYHVWLGYYHLMKETGRDKTMLETCSEQRNQISHLGLQLNAIKNDLKQPLPALLFLVCFPAEAKSLVNHRWWIPKGMYLNGRAIEMTSILGPFFHVSALLDHTIFKSQPDVGQQCFSEATTRRPANLLSAFSTIKNVMNNLYDGLGEVLLISLKNMDTR